MITYKELLEKKMKGYTITIKEPKDSQKAATALRRNKIKFSDESQQEFLFKKESDWDKAMDVLDDINVEYDFDG